MPPDSLKVTAKKNLDYGRKLSGVEYDTRMVSLQENLPSDLSAVMERQVRRTELDITIDYRLGCDFPQDKRDQLWVIQERVEKKRARLILKYFFRLLFKKYFARSTQNLANYLIAEYSKVLTKEELELYFGKTELENPTLPIDLDSIK